MKKIIFLSAVLLCCAVFAGKNNSREAFAPMVFDFSKKTQISLNNQAAVVDGVLKLNGKTSYALVPDSRKVNVTEKGLTLVATVKMDYDPASKALPHRVHSFFFKKGAFLFGKFHNQLYVNIAEGNKWRGYTVTNSTPDPGVWTHVAAVIERFYDPAQSDVGYRVSIYVNGELEITRKFQNLKPANNKNMVDIGRGFGGPWHLNGEVANAAIYGRPLTAAEISKLCSQEKRVKAVRKGFKAVPEKLSAELDKLNDAAAPAKWAAAAIRRAAENGTGQEKLMEPVKILQKLKNLPFDKFKVRFNASGKQAKILDSGKLAAFVLIGKGSGIHPVAGVMDLQRGKEIFGERTTFWSILWRQGKKNGEIHYNSPQVTWQCVPKGNTLVITWQGKGDIPFTAKSNVSFKGSRMESDFSVRNNSKAIIDAVKYPLWSFAPLGKGDTLIHPYMSGVQVKNPLVEQFRATQAGTYPSGRISMQFGAYCNQANEGIYFAYEDPNGYTKSCNVEGKRSNLNVVWQNPVIADKGKNHFNMSGKAVVETFRGNWYEAGCIYRRFLENKAVWWIKDLPRKSTPEWFRNNALWIRIQTRKRENVEYIRDLLVFLRSYFELPYNVHWYEWNDSDVAGWPHFPAKDYTPAILKSIKEADIRVLPYIDDRLWRQKDGPAGKSDWKYSSEGIKYAARTQTGGLNIERYSKEAVYTVMCPGAAGWQDLLVRLTMRMSNEGFNGAYHDQVGTAAPKLCYDRRHGHPANDPSLWLQQGYWKIFDRIFAEMRKKDPAFCHTTEENAEAYLKQFDGFLAARWTDAEQIPLYQSIYSGRVQFVGRLFNCLTPGSWQSFFSKLAQQLVNAEQLGWFQPSEVSRPDQRRLFTKKAMHMRLALLKYFNEGRMLAPIDFGNTMKYETCVWSGYVPHPVTMPQIASSAWQGADGSRMWLFVNSLRKPSEAAPAVESSKGFWICREGAQKPVFSKTAPVVRLAGMNFEVWIEGSREQAEQIQKTLYKISRFDRGAAFIRKDLKFGAKKSVGKAGKFYGVGDSIGHSMCKRSGNSHFGWMEDGALVSYGEIDFGKKGAAKLFLKYAVDAAHAGGTVEFLSASAGKQNVIAVFDLSSSGSWKKFKNISVKLDKQLTGKHNVMLRVNGNSSCNLAGWSYLDK